MIVFTVDGKFWSSATMKSTGPKFRKVVSGQLSNGPLVTFLMPR